MLSSLNWGSMFSSYPPGAERPRESILAGADIRPDAATAVQTLLLTESWDTTATDTQLEDQINQSCYNVLCKIPAEVYHSRHKENISETKWDLKKALTLYLVGLWEKHICTNMDCHVIWQKWKWSKTPWKSEWRNDAVGWSRFLEFHCNNSKLFSVVFMQDWQPREPWMVSQSEVQPCGVRWTKT